MHKRFCKAECRKAWWKERDEKARGLLKGLERREAKR